jgi:hypothetical protein
MWQVVWKRKTFISNMGTLFGMHKPILHGFKVQTSAENQVSMRNICLCDRNPSSITCSENADLRYP